MIMNNNGNHTIVEKLCYFQKSNMEVCHDELRECDLFAAFA